MPRVLVFVVAIAAAGLGVWFSWSNAPLEVASSEIYATDLAGESVDIRAGNGKPKLVNFWASWCAPCVVELPIIERYAAEHAQQLEVLAVAIDTLPHVNDFLAEHPVDLPIAVGTAHASDLMTEWGNTSSALPFSAMLDAEGKLLRVHLGPFDEASLVAFVDQE